MNIQETGSVDRTSDGFCGLYVLQLSVRLDNEKIERNDWAQMEKKVKVAHTRLTSVGFRS